MGAGSGEPPRLRVVPPPAPGPLGSTPVPLGVALARGLCPRCRQGSIFASRWRMHRSCPSCGLVYEREPGYFLGAMYLSYGMAIPAMGLLCLLVRWLWPGAGLGRVLLIASLLFLPLVPLVFRYSRTLWIHFDRAVDRES